MQVCGWTQDLIFIVSKEEKGGGRNCNGEPVLQCCDRQGKRPDRSLRRTNQAQEYPVPDALSMPCRCGV